MLYPPPHSLPPPPNFLPPRISRFSGPPPTGPQIDMQLPGLPPPSAITHQVFQAPLGLSAPPPHMQAPAGMVMLPRRDLLPPPPVHLALPPPRTLPPPPVAQRGMIPDLRSPPPSLRLPDWARPPETIMAPQQQQQLGGTLVHRLPVASVGLQQPPPMGSAVHLTSLPPPPTVQSVYPSQSMPPPTMVVGPANYVNHAYMAPPSTMAAPPVSVAMVSQAVYSDPYIRPLTVTSNSGYYTTDLYSTQTLQQPREPREQSRIVQPSYERSERSSVTSSTVAAATSQGRYTPSERHVPRKARSPDRRETASVLKLSERDFDDILQRNKSVSSGAIMRAVQDASAGEFASAIETLVTAISLIKQSRISNDDRCKILISSLQDTLHGIESKSYGSKSLSSRGSDRRSGSDYEKPISSRSVNAVVRARSRSPRDHELRTRDYSRSGGGEPRGASRDPEPRSREYSSRSVVVESSRLSSRDEEPRTREYTRTVAVEPPRGSSHDQESRSREYRRPTVEPRALSNDKERYYEPVVVAPASTLERSRSDRSERVERVVATEREVERPHRTDRTEREYTERVERDVERVPRERTTERPVERESERTRERAVVERSERDYVERETERPPRDRATEREYTERVERDYLERDGERHRERVSEREYTSERGSERDRTDRSDRDYGIRSSRHYSSQKHSQI